MMNTYSKAMMTPALSGTPLTDRCSLVLEDGRHACFGISPFNSYFSTQRITDLALWGLQTFDQVDFFVPDTPSTFTLEALGYSPARAAWKADRQGRYTRNKIHTALDACDTDTSRARILGWEELSQNKAFTQLHDQAHRLYTHNGSFRAACQQASSWVLAGKLPSSPKPAQIESAVQYLLAELPLFIDTPVIVGAPSSVFCYHQAPSFLTHLYQRKLPWHPTPHQGFATIVAS